MSVVSQIVAVFNEVGNWLLSAFSLVLNLFYNPATGLTFFGTLMVISLCIGVFLLILGIIQRWCHLRS